MTATIAATIWVLGIIAWGAIRWPRRRKAKRTKVATHRRTRAERIALSLCILGLVIIPALFLATGRPAFADYGFSPVAGWLGLLAMIAFLVLFHLSHKHLGKNWSVTLEMREDHKLVTEGLYKYVRHPMYSSFWLWGIAQALLIPNLVAGFAGLASIAWLYFTRIDKEEEMMRSEFGKEYDEYCTRTGRVFPRLW